MLDLLRLKTPLYPLAAFGVSIVTMAAGMLFSKSLFVFGYIAVLALLYICFGFAKVIAKIGLATAAFGLVLGTLAMLSSGGRWETLLQTLARTLLLGVCAVPLISIPPANLMRCLTQLRCPRIINLGMLVTLRFIPVLVGEIRQIWEAMKTRGVRTAWYRISCLYRAFFIPLTMRIVNISDTLSLSLETRGFVLDDKEATVYAPVRFRARDAIFSSLALCATAGLAVIAAL